MVFRLLQALLML